MCVCVGVWVSIRLSVRSLLVGFGLVWCQHHTLSQTSFVRLNPNLTLFVSYQRSQVRSRNKYHSELYRTPSVNVHTAVSHNTSANDDGQALPRIPLSGAEQSQLRVVFSSVSV